MRKYVIRRVLLLVPSVIMLSFLVFGIIRLIPGDVVELMVSEGGFADDTEELREMLGLDQPVLAQYFKYIKGVVKGDLGTSLWSGEPVLSEISRRLPISFELALMALIWTFLLGVPIGVISALKQDTGTDYALRSLAIGGLSIPGFWIATLILVFGSIWFKWVPPMDYIPFREDPIQNLSQLVVPSFVLSLALSAGIMRMTRTMEITVSGIAMNKPPVIAKFNTTMPSKLHAQNVLIVKRQGRFSDGSRSRRPRCSGRFIRSSMLSIIAARTA